MTEPPSNEPAWPMGSIANGHVLTESGWVPFLTRSRDAGPPWNPGDVVDGHVLNGNRQWVQVPMAVQLPWAAEVSSQPKNAVMARWSKLPVELRVAAIVIAVLIILSIIGNLTGA